jgi:LysR family transcriptional regulator, low CO2-responsive transcriptional regulator
MIASPPGEIALTLNQLRTFVAVAETGSVRAAAEDLVVTQAAVSASLAAMQRSLGVRLIRPDGRGLRLTSAGEEYAAYAHRVLGLLDEARRAAVAAADPERGELRIAAVTTAAEQIAPGLLSGFRKLHPHTGVLLEAGNRDRVRTLLDHHRVDLALAGRPEPGWDVRVHAVRAHELVVVSSPELAAESRAADSGPAGADTGGAETGGAEAGGILPWLARQPWLLREPGSGTRLSTEALLAELDITPPTLTVGSNGAIRESAAVGLGVTLVSRDAVALELASGRLAEIRVPGTPLHRDWYLLANPGRLPLPAARLVAHVLRGNEFQPARPAAGDGSTAS